MSQNILSQQREAFRVFEPLANREHNQLICANWNKIELWGLANDENVMVLQSLNAGRRLELYLTLTENGSKLGPNDQNSGSGASDTFTTEFLDEGFGDRVDRVSQSLYQSRYKHTQCPIVIDCGAYQTRAGFAIDPKPRIQIRSLVVRNAKALASSSTSSAIKSNTLVGDQIPYAEAYRLRPRSPFERNVVCHFEVMELLLDYVFTSLGLGGSDRVNHPIMFTEAVCNPNYSRSRLSQLLLRCYGVPAVCYGVGDLFAYADHHDQSRHRGKSAAESNGDLKEGDGIGVLSLPPLADGMIVSSGYEVTHVIPVLDGKPDFLSAACVPVGGLHAHRLLFDSLLLKYPQHTGHLSLNRCHELTHRFAQCAEASYVEELRIMKAWQEAKQQEEEKRRKNAFSPPSTAATTPRDRSSKRALPRTPQAIPVKIQLPLPAVPLKREETEEEKRQKKKRKRDHIERLKLLASKRRLSRIMEEQAALDSFDSLAGQLEDGTISKEDFARRLTEGGFDDPEDFETERRRLRKKLQDTRAREEERRKKKRKRSTLTASKSPSSSSKIVIRMRAPMKTEGTSVPVKAKVEGGAAAEAETKSTSSSSTLYPLALVTDPSSFTEEQKKEWRRQKLLKGAEEARARKRQAKLEAQKRQEEKERREREKYDNDPKGYVTELHAERRRLLSAQRDAKEKKQAAASSSSTMMNKGDRRAHKRRALKALLMGEGAIKGEGGGSSNNSRKASSSSGISSAASKGPSTAENRVQNGEDDDDDDEWEAYRQQGNGAAANGGAPAATRLSWIEKLLATFDPTGLEAERERESRPPPPKPSDFQIELFVERIRCPEVLFQPSMIGRDFAGLAEAIENVFKRLGPERRDRASKNVVVMGGNSMHPRFCDRVKYHVRSSCPAAKPVEVLHARNPIMGAWEGARKMALSPAFQRSCVTVAAIEARGEEGERGLLVEHAYSNIYYPTPSASSTSSSSSKSVSNNAAAKNIAVAAQRAANSRLAPAASDSGKNADISLGKGGGGNRADAGNSGEAGEGGDNDNSSSTGANSSSSSKNNKPKAFSKGFKITLKGITSKGRKQSRVIIPPPDDA
eukprot:jgi/Bigna1/68101/fgenesh1_pg.5_\